MTSTLPPPETAPSFDAMLAELREMLAKDKPGVWVAPLDDGDVRLERIVAKYGDVTVYSVLARPDPFDDRDAELTLAAKCRNVMPAVLADRDQMAELLRWRDLTVEPLPKDEFARFEVATRTGKRYFATGVATAGYLALIDRIIGITHWRPLSPGPCEQR